MSMNTSTKGENILEKTNMPTIQIDKNNNLCTIDQIPMQT